MAAKNNGTGGARGSKMNAVREILRVVPNAKASEIARRAEAEYGVEITPKVAGTYRYHIMSRQRREQRKAVRSRRRPSRDAGQNGRPRPSAAGRRKVGLAAPSRKSSTASSAPA